VSTATFFVVVAALAPSVKQELCLLFGAAVTLLGAWLCWYAPRQQMSIEEHQKDGRITWQQARQRLRLAAVAGPIVTLAGFAMIAAVLLG
jgi:hypothetical protein